jgi:hypothetical protein
MYNRRSNESFFEGIKGKLTKIQVFMQIYA